jgi:hypothetical protein
MRRAAIVAAAFVLSRWVARSFGVTFECVALEHYWQYLDVETLRHALLRGLWYDHAQPPVFNLLLGLVLKTAGAHTCFVFSVLLHAVTLVNGLLLLRILQRVLPPGRVPLLLALFYILSPAAIVLETELFYTTFVSMLLLLACRALLAFEHGITLPRAAAFAIPLTLVCLTRSMYHLVWLVAAYAGLLILYRHDRRVRLLAAAAVCSAALVTLVYAKNAVIFGQFSASSWGGMSLARNVFHDAAPDRSAIEAIPPFSPIAMYRPFLSDDTSRFAGLNDRDLFEDTKTSGHENKRHVGFIEVSRRYREAAMRHVRAQPISYVSNVTQAAITFFAPATRYSAMEHQAWKIRYYDLLYAFNVSHFVTGKTPRRVAMAVSALPEMALYAIASLWLARRVWRLREIGPVNLFIAFVIGYVFLLGSLIERYENMRFRFEVEPLFLVVLGQAIAAYVSRRRGTHANP